MKKLTWGLSLILLAAGCGKKETPPAVAGTVTHAEPTVTAKEDAAAKKTSKPAADGSQSQPDEKAEDSKAADKANNSVADTGEAEPPPSQANAAKDEPAKTAASAPSTDKPIDDESEKEAMPQHVANFVFLGNNAPVFIRLQLFVGDASMDQIRQTLGTDLLTAFDGDHDNKLSAKEFPLAVFREDMRPGEANGGMQFSSFDKDGDGFVNHEELVQSITSAGPLVTLGPGQQLDPRVLRLFQYLDRSYDNLLSDDEFKASDESLRRFDLDGDELISIDELGGYQNPMMNQFTSMSRGDAGPFRMLPVPVSDKETHRRLRYYDWSQGGLGYDDETFSRFDTGKNGTIEEEELEALLRNPPPHLDLVVRFGELQDGQSPLQIVSDQKRLESVFASAKHASERAVVMEVNQEHTQVTLRFEDDSPAVTAAQRLLHQQFVAMDSDNNMYLSPEEWSANASAVEAFADLDKDGDGKLYEEELTLFINFQIRLRQLRAELSASLIGCSLFEVIDENRDRRLSRRELLNGKEALSQWDADGDEKLALSEIPRQYEVVLRRDQPAIVRTAFTLPEIRQLASKSQSQVGPRWFRRMDTNGDGAVSRREFLGDASQFAQLDANQDDMLDASEVSAVKP